MGRVIAIANQKGGVGKTTTAVNLGASLAADNRRVLVVDVDPQGNATSGFGIAHRQLDKGTYQALIDQATLADVTVDSALPHLKIAPANSDLAGASLELASMENAHTRLRNALDGVQADYDDIIIDCPPSLDLLTINGLSAADSVLVPVQCEYYAMEGLSKLAETIEMVKESLNESLRIEGIVFTMYDPRNNLAHQVINEVQGFFQDQVFETRIPRNIRLSEAPSHGKPCLLYDLPSRGAQAYIQLARELLVRRESAA
ncbi:MAG: AAA family ATPase [Myxococcales bacterium]|nr:AAA family ATPase [Myxococcales bacterium]